MNVQTVVRRKSDGATGVVVNDNFGCCLPSEVPVVYHGTTSFLGTEVSDLEEVGPENAAADFRKCGAGQGAECCRFLVGGAGGAECARFSSMRDRIIFKSDMNAKRDPSEPYPECMIFEDNP